MSFRSSNKLKQSSSLSLRYLSVRYIRKARGREQGVSMIIIYTWLALILNLSFLSLFLWQPLASFNFYWTIGPTVIYAYDCNVDRFIDGWHENLKREIERYMNSIKASVKVSCWAEFSYVRKCTMPTKRGANFISFMFVLWFV